MQKFKTESEMSFESIFNCLVRLHGTFQCSGEEAANFKHDARSTSQLDTAQKYVQYKNNCNTNSESRAPDSRRSCLDFVLLLLLPYYFWSNFPSLRNLLVTQYYWKMAGSLLTLLCNNRPQISRVCHVIAQFLLYYKLTRLYLKLG